jgi:hypothetical protein
MIAVGVETAGVGTGFTFVVEHPTTNTIRVIKATKYLTIISPIRDYVSQSKLIIALISPSFSFKPKMKNSRHKLFFQDANCFHPWEFTQINLSLQGRGRSDQQKTADQNG